MVETSSTKTVTIFCFTSGYQSILTAQSLLTASHAGDERLAPPLSQFGIKLFLVKFRNGGVVSGETGHCEVVNGHQISLLAALHVSLELPAALGHAAIVLLQAQKVQLHVCITFVKVVCRERPAHWSWPNSVARWSGC